VFLLDERERDLHVTQDPPSNLPDYADLQVNREEAVKLWPHPLRERWKVQTITLSAHYFNSPPDEIAIDCKSITLFDPHIETKRDGIGAQYQEMVQPGYILATGINAEIVRTLKWKPQRVSFVDIGENIEREYVLSEGVEVASARNGRISLPLSPHGMVAFQAVSPEQLTQAAEFFAARTNFILSGVDAPVVLAQGAKVVLQIMPASALTDEGTIDQSKPQLLARHFMPDRYQKVDGRPRQEGWVWYQPPQSVTGLPNPVSDWHSRLDWNGFVEIVLVLEQSDGEGQVKVIHGYPLERYIVKTLDAIAEGYQWLDLRSAVMLRVTLLGVLGTRVMKSALGSAKGFDRSVVTTQVLALHRMSKPLGRALRPILDSIWRSAGWPDGSPSFASGDWEGYKDEHPYV
jgi:hypothetical protein